MANLKTFGIQKTKVTGSRLTDFISLAAVRDEFTVAGKKVIMQTLPGGILRRLSESVDGFDVYTKDRALKIEILARSLRSMDGNSLIPEMEEGTNDSRAEIIRKIINVIDRWEQPVIDMFYEKYIELLKVQKEFIDELKKG